jgi:hypothetical protein
MCIDSQEGRLVIGILLGKGPAAAAAAAWCHREGGFQALVVFRVAARTDMGIVCKAFHHHRMMALLSAYA